MQTSIPTGAAPAYRRNRFFQQLSASCYAKVPREISADELNVVLGLGNVGGLAAGAAFTLSVTAPRPSGRTAQTPAVYEIGVNTMRPSPTGRVEPEWPPSGPPGWPTKSILYSMSKKLSTFQLLPGGPIRVKVVWPGLGIPNAVPAVMRRRSKSGSPAGSCPCSMNISLSND